mgnify:CR=1 FL=1
MRSRPSLRALNISPYPDEGGGQDYTLAVVAYYGVGLGQDRDYAVSPAHIADMLGLEPFIDPGTDPGHDRPDHGLVPRDLRRVGREFYLGYLLRQRIHKASTRKPLAVSHIRTRTVALIEKVRQI